MDSITVKISLFRLFIPTQNTLIWALTGSLDLTSNSYTSSLPNLIDPPTTYSLHEWHQIVDMELSIFVQRFRTYNAQSVHSN